MSIDGKLLEILCCPVSKTPLIRITSSQLANLNRTISEGRVVTVDGKPVKEPLREALVTEDHKVVYPVVDGIPVLLEEQGIGTVQLENF